MQTLHPQTRENLLRAMRREAFAFASDLLYATQARRHGRPQLAERFEQVANQEYFGHFVEQALEVGLIGMGPRTCTWPSSRRPSRPRSYTATSKPRPRP